MSRRFSERRNSASASTYKSIFFFFQINPIYLVKILTREREEEIERERMKLKRRKKKLDWTKVKKLQKKKIGDKERV